MECRSPRIGKVVVEDTGLARAERDPADTTPCRVRFIDRQGDLARALAGWTGAGHDFHEIAAGLRQRDGGGGEPAAGRRRLANQLIQFVARSRPNDRLIGRAERREHACQAFFLLLGLRLFVIAIEIVEGECDILRKALQQLDQFGTERAELAR